MGYQQDVRDEANAAPLSATGSTGPAAAAAGTTERCVSIADHNYLRSCFYAWFNKNVITNVFSLATMTKCHWLTFNCAKRNVFIVHTVQGPMNSTLLQTTWISRDCKQLVPRNIFERGRKTLGFMFSIRKHANFWRSDSLHSPIAMTFLSLVALDLYCL